MKREANDHPKLWDLVDRLPAPYQGRAFAMGLLEGLWHFTAKFTPRGDVGSKSNAALARWLGWPGDPDVLVAALVDAHWLDEHPDHRLVVHDWPAHADDAVHRQLARARLFFADGSAPNWKRLNPEERKEAGGFYQSSPHAGRTSGARRAHGGSEPEPRLSPAPPEPEAEDTQEPPAAPAPRVERTDTIPWDRIQAAFATYGRPVRVLSPARQRVLLARAKETTPEALVDAVHGYMALHAGRKGDFDPLRHLTPETVYRAGKFAKYLESYERERQRGREPPFLGSGSSAQDLYERVVARREGVSR